MNGYCPICEREGALVLKRGIEQIDVRGEEIPVEIEYYQCQECGEEFENPQPDRDPLEIAYKEYRSRKGFVRPEEIRNFRKKFGLTQMEFSQLLGIGIATLSRYENGALQSEAHDLQLKLAMKPDNFLHLLKSKPGVLDEAKVEKIIERLKEDKKSDHPLMDFYEEELISYKPDIKSGYKSLDLEKFFNAILYFCYADEVPKTKLNKLLFYADFLHFKLYNVSITGARYARLPYGPVPDNFNLLFATMIDERGSISVEERPIHDFMGEFFTAQSKPNLSIFAASELKILASVKEFFEGFNSRQISEFSHKERGYVETEIGRLISYDYADNIETEI